MAQDFLNGSMVFSPKPNPTTGRFEETFETINLEKMMEEKNSLFKNLKLDFKTEEQIETKIKNLAASYVPEWNFDMLNPDIGAAFAISYAKQTHKNTQRLNQNIEQYHREFVNLLDISPKPAKESQTVVLVESKEDTVLESGTKFFAKKEKQTFETKEEAYITSANLKSVFMTCKESGKVLPIMGEFKIKNYVGEYETYFSKGRKKELTPFSLFQFQQKGLEKNALVLFHSCIFDVKGESLDCKIEGAPEFIREIEKDNIEFFYYNGDGFQSVINYSVTDSNVQLKIEGTCQPVQLEDKFYYVIVLQAKKLSSKSIYVNSITFSASGNAKNIEFAGNHEIDYIKEQFPVFGEKLVNGSECYIGLNEYFSKKDSRIFLKFRTVFEERAYGVLPKKKSKTLKLIKRRIKDEEQEKVPYVFADEISIEYYNGLGWKRLVCDREYKNLFAQGKETDVELVFSCPKDWEEEQIGSYYGKVLRIRLLNAINSDLDSGIHYIPFISHIAVSYSYEDNRQIPEIAKVFSGTKVKDITKELLQRSGVEVFGNRTYSDTSLYLGFDKKLNRGPFSLWWQLTGAEKEGELKFSYSTIHGFKNIKIKDFTRNLTQSGLMIFDFPKDMDFLELEGEKCCWIRMDHQGEINSNIKIHQIVPNGIVVHHTEKNGTIGNIEAGAIMEMENKELRINKIYTPIAAFGGCEAESKEKMLHRGMHIFNSGNRLVTEKDFEREVLYFSDNIDKVSVINGMGKDNVFKERMLYVVPLMKDFEKGKESFYQIQEKIKQHLLQHCDISISEDELQIELPVFVKLNVEVWVECLKQEQHFEIKNLVEEILEKFLNPVSNKMNKGWDIGVIPGKSQIMIRLNSLKNCASIRHLLVTAQYEDFDGIHEIDIEDIKSSPYMVVINGSHRVHISNQEEQ